VTTPVWVAELAGWFWDRAGPPPPFPRDLRVAVTRSLVGSIVLQPGLSVRSLLDWLASSGIQPPELRCSDRPLRGALYAREGESFLFIASDDEPAEQRFSLAHELAHLLRDYLQPRFRAIAALGREILDVLDGWRLPTPAERIHALLRDLPVAPYTHLLTRDDGTRTPAITTAERDADRLACELLVPAAEVFRRVGMAGAAMEATKILEKEYGLPPIPAQFYANELFPTLPSDPLLTRLEKIFDSSRRTPL
jgi:hypothetical protein